MAYTLGEAVEHAITRHQRHLAAAVTAQAQLAGLPEAVWVTSGERAGKGRWRIVRARPASQVKLVLSLGTRACAGDRQA